MADEEVEVAMALVALMLETALIPAARAGDDLVCDLGPVRYRLDVRGAVRDAGYDVVRAARRGVALVRALAALVEPGRPTAPLGYG